MRQRLRLGLYSVAALVLLALLAWGLAGLPRPGEYRGPYGDVVNARVVGERHVTDAVGAVTYDYRAFDTLGEELILFVSVMGAITLLRQTREEDDLAPDDADIGEDAPAVRLWTLLATGPLVVFGVYVVTHGLVSPGGGFQGGVVLATVPLVVFLAGGLGVFRRVTSRQVVELAEAAGVGALLLAGVAGWLRGAPYLANVLPLGEAGRPNAGGLMPVLSVCVGLGVAGGFVLLLRAFLEAALADEEEDADKPQDDPEKENEA